MVLLVLRSDSTVCAQNHIKVASSLTEELFVRMFTRLVAEPVGTANRFAERLSGREPILAPRHSQGAQRDLLNGGARVHYPAAHDDDSIPRPLGRRAAESIGVANRFAGRASSRQMLLAPQVPSAT